MQPIKNVARPKANNTKIKNDLMYEANLYWIDYKSLLQIASRRFNKNVTALNDLSITELRQLKQEIRTERMEDERMYQVEGENDTNTY